MNTCLCLQMETSQARGEILFITAVPIVSETQTLIWLMREFHITCNNLKTFVYENSYSKPHPHGIHRPLFLCPETENAATFSFTSNISVLCLIFNVFKKACKLCPTSREAPNLNLRLPDYSYYLFLIWRIKLKSSESRSVSTSKK